MTERKELVERAVIVRSRTAIAGGVVDVKPELRGHHPFSKPVTKTSGRRSRVPGHFAILRGVEVITELVCRLDLPEPVVL